jgi:hypothetical protein
VWNRAKDIVVILIAITLLAPNSLAGMSTPEILAAKTSEYAKKGDWAAYAKVMHPEALSSLKKIFRPIAEADTSGQVLRRFFGVPSLARYDSMADADIFQAFMANLTRNFPGFADAMQSHETSVVGSVPEGKELVHVVYRMGAKTEGMTISKTSVITFRRHNGKWKALLTGNIEGLAARLSQLSQRRDPKR